MVSSLNFAPGMDGHGKPYGVMQWQNVRILSQFQAQVCSLGPKLREHPAFSCRWMRTLCMGRRGMQVSQQNFPDRVPSLVAAAACDLNLMGR